MKKLKIILFVGSVFLIRPAFSQTIGVDNGGDGTWDDPNTYTVSNIPDNVNENVNFANNVGTVILEASQNYTVGNIATANGNTITVNGTLNVGSSVNAKNYTSGNSGTLNVNGTVVIWGDLNVNNNYILNVSGTLIIKGNINLNNNANLTINGDVTVDGDFVGGNNTAIAIEGSMDVGGDFEVGAGSTATGSGTITYGGTCADSASGVCTSGPLPIELTYFELTPQDNAVKIKWITATEENNDYFEILRSRDGVDYNVIATIEGAGNSTQALSYEYIDKSPLIGQSYYRLKQTDFDGKNETFSAKGVYVTTLADLVFSPNPVENGNKLTIYTGASSDESVSVEILSVSGKTLLLEKLAGEQSQINIPSEMERGVYFLKVSSGNKQFVKRLLVK